MDLQKGSVVKNKSGKYKNRFFVVCDLDETCVFVCDGKYRKLLNLKKKNRKHVSVSNTVLDIKELDTDKKIRTALKKFND